MFREFVEQSFYPLWLRGQVSNLTIHRSGHVYFSVKDARSQVSAVFFRGAGKAREMGLKEGDEVDVYGRLTVYEPRGSYQIQVSQIRPQGKGDLQRRFEELKERLRAAGWFDEDRKRPIHMLPKCVGVVTSPSGAAIQDFLQILGRRFSNVHVRIFPAAVQGERAAAEVAAGVQFFNRTRCCDVIVVTRGGGSMEDLWPFNEAAVVKAVYQSELPVISAVGHEVDFTICDFVADLRVPTPSAAAELVTAHKEEMLQRLHSMKQRLSGGLQLKISNLRRRTERASHHPVFREPKTLVRMQQQRVDELRMRMQNALERSFERAQTRFARVKTHLNALNPHGVLKRGYSILIQEEGGAVKHPAEVCEGQRMRAVLAEGEMYVVKDKDNE